ncbi:MAG: hypothetical protein D6704_03600 [Nitrospirae bacterium]|nr:MAG: hypothetical protein D6704_03600 [Nitrospirota bacterium]
MSQGRALEALVDRLLQDYLARNHAARVIKTMLDHAGIGLKPVLDHITIRTYQIDERAKEFEALGYCYTEILEYTDWYAKVYRAPGFPTLFIDQAYADRRGEKNVIPRWVDKFGDRTLHHVAVLVEDIERAVRRLEQEGVRFAGSIVGEKGAVLRQIFTAPELVEETPFSVLELTERHAGYQGFSPPQAHALMQSTVKGDVM